MNLNDPSFETWVAHIFDHPVTEPAWHWDLDADEWNFSDDPDQALEYVQRLFEDIAVQAVPYTDEQLNQGLWYLINNSCSNYSMLLQDARLPQTQRADCVRSVYTLYADLFKEKCAPTLGHLDEPGHKPLNSICYMIWDIIPLHGNPGDENWKEIDQACVEVMERTLKLKSPSCQEGALHGLGHWKMHYPKRVIQIIDRFIAANPKIHPGLLSYAKRARTGHIL